MALRIDGKAIAAALRGEIAAEVETLKVRGIIPGDRKSVV